MSATSGTIHVLHVDDEPDFTGMAAEFIERQNERFVIETTTSASDALERLSKNSIHCIVSDFDMPGQNGLQLLQAIRKDYPDLPFILYTGKGSEEVASEAISAGVTEYLQKEIGTSQYQVLANRIENAVERYRAYTVAAEMEVRLQTIAENTDDILWMFNADWTELLFINSAYEEVAEVPTTHLRDRPLSFLDGIHPDDKDDVEAAMDAVSAGESVDIEYRVHSDEGFDRWVWVKGQPVFDDSGAVDKVVGFARDVTDRNERERELEETKAELEAIVTEQEHHLEAFNGFLDIATDSTLTFDEQMDDVLELGVEYLGLDIGILAKIDPPDYTVQQVVTPDGSIEPGTQFDLTETFCELVFESDGPVCFRSPSEGGVMEHPAYRDLGLESYIGEPLIVDDHRYGTLNFSSPNQREQSFTDSERAFIRTLAEWVSHELRREELE